MVMLDPAFDWGQTPTPARAIVESFDAPLLDIYAASLKEDAAPTSGSAAGGQPPARVPETAAG